MNKQNAAVAVYKRPIYYLKDTEGLKVKGMWKGTNQKKGNYVNTRQNGL